MSPRGGNEKAPLNASLARSGFSIEALGLPCPKHLQLLSCQSDHGSPPIEAQPGKSGLCLSQEVVSIRVDSLGPKQEGTVPSISALCRQNRLKVLLEMIRPFCGARTQLVDFLSTDLRAHVPSLGLMRHLEKGQDGQHVHHLTRFFPKPSISTNGTLSLYGLCLVPLMLNHLPNDQPVFLE